MNVEIRNLGHFFLVWVMIRVYNGLGRYIIICTVVHNQVKTRFNKNRVNNSADTELTDPGRGFFCTDLRSPVRRKNLKKKSKMSGKSEYTAITLTVKGVHISSSSFFGW